MKRVRFENDDVTKETPKACYCCLNVKTGVHICIAIFIFKMLFDLAFSIDAFFFEHLFYFHPVRATSSTFFNLMGVIPLFLILLHVFGTSRRNWYALTWLIYNAMMILANIIYIPVCDPFKFRFDKVADVIYEFHLMVTVIFFIWSTIVAMLYYRLARDESDRPVRPKKEKRFESIRVNEEIVKKDTKDSDSFHYAEMV